MDGKNGTSDVIMKKTCSPYLHHYYFRTFAPEVRTECFDLDYLHDLLEERREEKSILNRNERREIETLYLLERGLVWLRFDQG